MLREVTGALSMALMHRRALPMTIGRSVCRVHRPVKDEGCSMKQAGKTRAEKPPLRMGNGWHGRGWQLGQPGAKLVASLACAAHSPRIRRRRGSRGGAVRLRGTGEGIRQGFQMPAGEPAMPLTTVGKGDACAGGGHASRQTRACTHQASLPKGSSKHTSADRSSTPGTPARQAPRPPSKSPGGLRRREGTHDFHDS